MAITFGAISADPRGAQGHDLRAGRRRSRGDPRRCAPAPVPARLRRALAAAAPGRPRPAHVAADPQQRARRGRAGAAAGRAPVNATLEAGLRRARGAGRRAADQDRRCSACGDTFDQATSAATYIAPYQTVCNYWNYWFTYLPEHLTQRDQVGFAQRVSLVGVPGHDPPPTELPDATRSTTTAGVRGRTAAPARTLDRARRPASSSRATQPILHGNPYGPARHRGSAELPGRPDRLRARRAARRPASASDRPGVRRPRHRPATGHRPARPDRPLPAPGRNADLRGAP